MEEAELRTSDSNEEIRSFLQLACAGDLDGIRAKVASGFDLNVPDKHGDSILEIVIRDLEDCPEIQKYEVVKELLQLGADAKRLNADGLGSLFAAVLNMDTEMLRILMDAGADPNGEKMDSEIESLYDWAEFDYRYEIWNINDYGNPKAQDIADEDAWLQFLDRMALAKGKRRPDHLLLLRARGALCMDELTELPDSQYFGVTDRHRNRFEIRLKDRPEEDSCIGNSHIRASTIIYVDGDEIEPQQFVDLPALIRSLKHAGRFEIFVCGCEVPRSCGALFHGVEVEHRRCKLIRWKLQRPQYVYSDEEPYDGTLGPPVTSIFWFRRRQMESALKEYFEALRKLDARKPGHVEWPIYGQSIGEILKLESSIASR